MSKRKADDFITYHDYHLLHYLKDRYRDKLIEQLKIEEAANNNKKKNNTTNNNKNKKKNNTNNGRHVNVLDNDRGPPMPDPMVRKIKEMMNMNDYVDNNSNESFMKRMVWLGQKKIEVTDTNTHHNRLFFPNGTNDKLMAFYSDDENLAIRVTENSKNNTDNDAPGRGLYVKVVDGEGDVWKKAMLLKWWRSVNKTVFTREWNLYVEERRLKPEVLSLQLWCFRDAQNKLCFAVNAVPTMTPANVSI